MKDYQYPLDLEWTTEEMVLVVHLWDCLEQAYESGISNDRFLEAYQGFKSVVKSIGEERKLGREFESISGYSLYHAVQIAKKNQNKILDLKE